jgi:hypothetical protein
VNLGERGNAEDTAPPAGVLPTAGTGHDGRRSGNKEITKKTWWRGLAWY